MHSNREELLLTNLLNVLSKMITLNIIFTKNRVHDMSNDARKLFLIVKKLPRKKFPKLQKRCIF